MARTAKPQVRRESLWGMATGLQEADGLELSGHALELGNRFVSSELGSKELLRLTEEHHRDKGMDPEHREADIVAARITSLLCDDTKTKAFRLIPHTLLETHKLLFDGVFTDRRWAGQYRSEDIYKLERVLGGRSVAYSPAAEIAMTLDYDFDQERRRPYPTKLGVDDVAHFARFISGIWQTHPFREGNTRTTAVFAHLYLRTLGIEGHGESFKGHGRWYRDALVRAEYSSIAEGICEDRSFLNMFYENVVLGAKNDLDSLNLSLEVR